MAKIRSSLAKALRQLRLIAHPDRVHRDTNARVTHEHATKVINIAVSRLAGREAAPPAVPQEEVAVYRDGERVAATIRLSSTRAIEEDLSALCVRLGIDIQGFNAAASRRRARWQELTGGDAASTLRAAAAFARGDTLSPQRPKDANQELLDAIRGRGAFGKSPSVNASAYFSDLIERHSVTMADRPSPDTASRLFFDPDLSAEECMIAVSALRAALPPIQSRYALLLMENGPQVIVVGREFRYDPSTKHLRVPFDVQERDLRAFLVMNSLV